MKVNSTLLSVAFGLSGCLTGAIFSYTPLNAQVSDQVGDAFFIENVRVKSWAKNKIYKDFREKELEFLFLYT